MISDDQGQLFGVIPQPRCRGQERLTVYAAVVTLRMAGHKVYRVGRFEHLVDGRRIGVKALCEMAMKR